MGYVSRADPSPMRLAHDYFHLHPPVGRKRKYLHQWHPPVVPYIFDNRLPLAELMAEANLAELHNAHPNKLKRIRALFAHRYCERGLTPRAARYDID